MALSKDELETSIKILKTLDEAIANGPWDYNLFFKGIGKKLMDARERFVRELGLEDLAKKESAEAEDESAKLFTEVYVSLYQAEGANISKWQTVINTLAGYNLTRPVYKSEIDIQEAIRFKEFKQNDAYVAVKIRKDDILKLTEKPPVDRYGHELLVLREGAVQQENISRFVHLSGQYDFRNKTLIKK